MNDDYKAMLNADLTETGSYNATGTATSVISARVSYVYNLHGTCLTLDTACSSGMVAIHLAIQAIKSGYYFLSYKKSCFQCNITIINFLVLHACEIRFNDVIGQSNIHMYSYEKKSETWLTYMAK